MSRSRGEHSFVRTLGAWGLAASIVNITVGGGIFRLPASAAQVLGPAAPVAYIICAIAMSFIVLCLAEAGSRVSITGGVYAYVEVAFGPLVGFLCGVLLWATLTMATAAVVSFFADALGALAPWSSSATGRQIAITVVLALLALLNIAGVRGAHRFNVVMTLAKLLPLVALIVVGAFFVRMENLRWTSTPAASTFARASIVSIFAFAGVETALVPSGEVRDPARTVPRGIFIAMIAIAALYLAVQIVTQGILGAALPGRTTPLADAAAAAMGNRGRSLILIGSVVSMFGYVSGATLAVPRMLFAFGRDGFLPARIAAVHPRFKTPHIAIACQSLVVMVLSVTGTFEKLVAIADGTLLLAYASCCLGVLELRRRRIEENGAAFRIPFGGVVPLVATAVIVWLLTSLGADEWKALLAVLGVALLVFVASIPARRAARVEESA